MQEKRVVDVTKGTVEVISGIGAIINVEGFSCLERMLRVTAYVLKFCTKFFEGIKGKIDKLVGVEDVMKEFFSQQYWVNSIILSFKHVSFRVQDRNILLLS